jgi:DNA-binding CsgD family transcriptional regulator
MPAPGAPPAVPSPWLRQRDAQLATIADHLGRLAAGRGGVVLVEGAAGAGRSRLLSETAAHASALGLAVAHAVADELTAAAPLATLTEALRRGATPVVSADELEELASAAGRGPDLVDHLGRLLAAHARRRPLVVSLDDLQWADPLTLLAVGTPPRRPAARPVLWVVSRRLLGAGGPAGLAFDRLAAAGAARLALEPLNPEAVRSLARELAGGEPDAELAAMLEDAAGVPAFVVELLRGLAAEERLSVTGGEATVRGQHLPGRLRPVVDAHLRPLTAEAVQLLEVGSVLGRSFTLDHAAALLGRPPADVRAPVAEAVAARVLDEEEAGLVFRQELVRRVVSDRLSESVRQAVHRDAGRLLLAEGRGAAEAVRHFTIGEAADDEETIDVLWQAARETAATAPGAAADMALRALRLVRWEDARRPELLAFVVPLLGSIGRLDEVEHLAAAALDGGLDPEAEARVRMGLAAGMARAGRSVAARHHVERGLEVTGPSGALAAGLLAVQAELLVRDDPSGAARVASAAVREGLAARDAGAAVGGRVALAVVALHRGQLSRAVAMATMAADIADRGGVQVRVRSPRKALAMALVGLGRFDEALAIAGTCRTAGMALGSPSFLAAWGNMEALAHLGAGRLDDARQAAAAALAAAAGRGRNPAAGCAHAILAEVAVRQGDLARARTHVDRAASLPDDPWGLSDARWQRALLTSADAGPATAMHALEAAFDALRRRRMGLGALDPSRLPLLVRMALGSGDPARAAVAADAASALARRNPGVPAFAGAAAHARGLLLGDVALLETAVDLLRAGTRPIALGEALEDLACAMAGREQDRDRAVAALEEAHHLLAAVGAAHDAARVRGLLRSLGTRRRYAAARARAMDGWASLTVSEQRTARLAADGLTNRAIAARLFVSPNTVSTHLRHAYAKLGVRSRAALARIVLEHGADGRSA